MNCLQGIRSDTENKGRPKVKRRCRGFNPLSEPETPSSTRHTYISVNDVSAYRTALSGTDDLVLLLLLLHFTQ